MIHTNAMVKLLPTTGLHIEHPHLRIKWAKTEGSQIIIRGYGFINHGGGLKIVYRGHEL